MVNHLWNLFLISGILLPIRTKNPVGKLSFQNSPETPTPPFPHYRRHLQKMHPLKLPNTQESLDIVVPDYVNKIVQDSIEELAQNSEAGTRGAIFTRREVVDFILDLVGYIDTERLYEKRLLEPSFGGGDFLLPIIERLLSAWESSNSEVGIVEGLGDAISSVELHHETFKSTFSSVVSLLRTHNISKKDATLLAEQWLTQGDFLLTKLEGGFDFVVGNPPYIRQELIPAPLMVEYRTRFQTIYDRADIYIPFIERGLSLLAKNGCLGFICADRWMKNKYGGPLRRFVAEKYHLKIYVDMVDTPAFLSSVDAYPAITIITKNSSGPTRTASRPRIENKALADLAQELRAPAILDSHVNTKEILSVTNGAEPWLLGSLDLMTLVRRLEANHPLIEDVGCKIGIGVATGADKAFIGDYESLDVEPDRKLPLVTTKDILSGNVVWRGLGVINPFKDAGGLVDLDLYPKLNRYLQSHYEAISRRHCVKKSPSNWYRTIDRITPALAAKQKLLIPDIKGDSHIVFERGELYPHHNLYYVSSEHWDLRSLQAVLLSSITKLFVATYSTRIRGGFLRFQAQYLRRLRLPLWGDVPEQLRNELAIAAVERDIGACDQSVFELYGISLKEQSMLKDIGT